MHARHSWVRLSTVCAATLLLISVAACTDDAGGSAPPPSVSVSVPVTASPASASPTDATPPVMLNDLARVPLKRTLTAAPVAFEVTYTTPVPVSRWSAGNSKPLRITATAVNRSRRGQKIYVTKVTMSTTPYDGATQLGSPAIYSDIPNLGPGYIVTSPNTYNQTFSVPPVDSDTSLVAIDLQYEVVLEVSRTKDGRDFAKQVLTDSLRVPLTS